MSERRFNEAEVAEIFERATKALETGRRQLPSSEGMTLSELQEIGREVGIPPEQLSQAARAIELGGRQTSRSFLGLPVGVGLTVDLERKLSDDEWDRFVVDLRETFDARGTLRQEGTLRHWANGNLQAHLEPTPEGQRIRLRTLKGDAQAMIIAGAGLLGFGAATWGAGILRGVGMDASQLSSSITLALMGISLIGIQAFRLPAWARRRRQQMEEVAARVAVSQASQSTQGRLP